MSANPQQSRGFSLIEMLIALAVFLFLTAGLFSFLMQNARINRTQQMHVEVQENARACLSIVVQKLRSAGWDALNAGIPVVTLDPDTSDDVSEIEIFADLNSDGATTAAMEQLWIRHTNNRVEWRPTASASQPFEVVAINISNDSDGDGIPEPMFVPDSTTDPRRITVRVTAQSPVPDPISGEFIRYSLSSDVVLRKNL